MAWHEDSVAVTHVLDARGRAVAQRFRAFELRVSGGKQLDGLHRFEQSTVRVGSHAGNDLVLEDEAVSRIHFEIIADESGYRLRDLESTNGTWVDGLRTLDTYLRPRSRIFVGHHTTIHFHLLEEQSDRPLSSADGFGPLVGRSAAMRELFATLEQVAPTDATALIQGESGTGKELIAEALHQASTRAGGPFVVFDCASVPSNLIESELFGHEKGAFTGAEDRRVGYMEEADGGTLFLDELGELPLELQPKLLRAVEKREVRPLGSSKSRHVNVRLVAATNRDLAAEVNAGTFRADLYYRFAVVRLRVPPLRERTDDIPVLVRHFLEKSLRNDPARAEAVIATLAVDDWSGLRRHAWRGNVRELRNVLERALVMSDNAPAEHFDVLSALSVHGVSRESLEDSLPLESVPTLAATTDPENRVLLSVDLEQPMLDQKKQVLAHFEQAYLQAMLQRNQNNLSRAAAAAGLDRSYFKRLCKKYELI